MPKTVIILILAALQFAACKLTVALTMQLGMFAADPEPAAGLLGYFLVTLTRVLYFPIITLALYNRNWFPGNWVAIPMITNSLIWGIGLYGCYRLLRRLRR